MQHRVVDAQGPVLVADLEQVQAVVPPVVDVQEVALLPVVRPRVQEPQPGREPALHLVRVRDGVDAPHVGRVPLDGFLADGE